MRLLQERHLWANFKTWVSKNRKVLLISGLIFVIICTIVATFLIISRKPTSTPKTSNTGKSIPAVKYYVPLTGAVVPDLATTKRPVTGMMIENSTEARPQSGLKDSGIVFEAIAEGGITRFLILYQSERPQVIGPVRSLRLYDIDWLAAFNAGIGHVGGSSAALGEIRNGNYRDLDQFFNSGSYYRASDRYSPHNVYTSFDRLDAMNTAKGYATSTFTPFSRVDGKPIKKPDASKIDITISSSTYNSSYAYDAKTNTYARFQAGAPHLDRESGQIAPSVVIALRVDETTIYEDGYRESIQTIGNGAATIFQNGTAIAATWHKASQLDQLHFNDANGNDIALVRGQTWISAVPNGSGDVTWQ